MYYPLKAGGNIDENLGTLKAMQTADKYKVALPLYWQPGGNAIVPPPGTSDKMQERFPSTYEMVDFYLATAEYLNIAVKLPGISGKTKLNYKAQQTENDSSCCIIRKALKKNLIIHGRW